MNTVTETTIPADPSLYRPHPLGYACRDCNSSARIGVAVRHTSSCDVAPREFVLPSDQAEDASSPSDRKANIAAAAHAKKLVRASTSTPSLAAAAKEGIAPALFSDREIADAVRRGEISESDAMNQDC